MSLTPFFVICGLICLFWLFVHSILAARLDSYKVLVFLLLSVFFSAGGDVLLGALMRSSTVTHLIVLLFAPAVIPLTCLYFAHVNRPLQSKPIHYIWVIVPAMLFTSGLVIAGLKGWEQTDLLLDRIHLSDSPLRDLSLDGTDYVFYIWTVVGFRVVMALELLDMIVYCAFVMYRYHFKPSNWFGFLFKGRKIRVLELQMTLSLFIVVGFFLKIFLYIPFYTQHPAFTVCVVAVVSPLLFLFGLFGLFGAKEYVALEDLPRALRFNFGKEEKAAVTEELVMEMVEELNPESLTKVISRMVIRSDASPGPVASRVPDAPSLTSALFKNAKSWDEGSLVSRFQRLMTDDQLFLQPGLGLEEVAARLKSNKTYISKMVNQTYGIGFPEVLNILRVDYAQQYMLKHKDASQEEIARASGFLSASSFNTVFKRITGYTPKVWSARK